MTRTCRFCLSMAAGNLTAADIVSATAFVIVMIFLVNLLVCLMTDALNNYWIRSAKEEEASPPAGKFSLLFTIIFPV